jgi:hypothetical protein
MKNYNLARQTELPLVGLVNEQRVKPAKRVNIVSLRLVKESSLLYKERS